MKNWLTAEEIKCVTPLSSSLEDCQLFDYQLIVNNYMLCNYSQSVIDKLDEDFNYVDNLSVWSGYETYSIGNKVQVGGIEYLALTQNTSKLPNQNPSDWQKIEKWKTPETAKFWNSFLMHELCWLCYPDILFFNKTKTDNRGSYESDPSLGSILSKATYTETSTLAESRQKIAHNLTKLNNAEYLSVLMPQNETSICSDCSTSNCDINNCNKTYTNAYSIN